jgi:hypothetical protein
LPIADTPIGPKSTGKSQRLMHQSIGNRQSKIGNALVDLARFERAASTFAESRSISTELQIRTIFDF